jgi:hypothetical protein
LKDSTPRHEEHVHLTFTVKRRQGARKHIAIELILIQNLPWFSTHNITIASTIEATRLPFASNVYAPQRGVSGFAAARAIGTLHSQ